MQAAEAALPEFDLIGQERVATPVRRARDVAIGKAGGDFSLTLFQPFATGDNLTLQRDPGTDLMSTGTAGEVALNLRLREFAERAANAHLMMPLGPKEDGTGIRIGGDLPPLAALVIGVEMKAQLIHTLEEHGACRRGTIESDGGEGHGVWFRQLMSERIVQPSLKQHVGIRGSSFLNKTIEIVAHTQVMKSKGRKVDHNKVRKHRQGIAAITSLAFNATNLVMAPLTGILSDLNRVLLSADQIHDRVSAMAAQIESDYAGKVLTVVVLMDGALFFVSDLLRQIDLPIRLVTLGASSYHGGLESSGQVKIQWPAGVRFAGEDVLLLDDILDTGLTLSALRERLLAESPASLRTAVLLDKKRPRNHDCPLDYCGFEIADEFVVGYGMDYQGRFRNLPCIGILKP